MGVDPLQKRDLGYYLAPHCCAAAWAMIGLLVLGVAVGVLSGVLWLFGVGAGYGG